LAHDSQFNLFTLWPIF